MILLPAYLDNFGRHKDGAGSLRFSTQEIPAETFKEFAELHGSFGWLAFRASETEPPELPDTDPELKGKSLTERLYAVLFVRWSQLKEKGQMDEPFESYRKRVMEGLIENFKSKLEPV